MYNGSIGRLVLRWSHCLLFGLCPKIRSLGQEDSATSPAMLLRSSKKRPASCISSESPEHFTSITPAVERSSSCKKRTKVVPQQKSIPQLHLQPKSPLLTLLTLPYEIRDQILHEVLTSPSSCLRWPHETEHKASLQNLGHRKGKNDSAVYPAVLRSCKQLRDEGLPILYRNTFGMDLHIDEDDDRLEFQGYDLSQGWNVIPYQARRQLFQLVRKLQVTIHVESDRDQKLPPLDTGESSGYRFVVSKLCERLLEMPNLASLHLTIALQNKHQFADDNEIGEQILTPLTLLRNVRCVTIIGVSSAYAQSLKGVMESHVHVQNLCAMRTALAIYLGDEYFEDEDWEGVQEAVNICDIGLFNERRAQIVARIDSQQAAKRERLYMFD
jgi:hypothetical protein